MCLSIQNSSISRIVFNTKTIKTSWWSCPNTDSSWTSAYLIRITRTSVFIGNSIFRPYFVVFRTKSWNSLRINEKNLTQTNFEFAWPDWKVCDRKFCLPNLHTCLAKSIETPFLVQSRNDTQFAIQVRNMDIHVIYRCTNIFRLSCLHLLQRNHRELGYCYHQMNKRQTNLNIILWKINVNYISNLDWFKNHKTIFKPHSMTLIWFWRKFRIGVFFQIDPVSWKNFYV